MVRKHLIKKSALALAVASAVSTSPILVAQDLEEITVTGTRIRVTDGMAAPTPVTSLTTLELMNFEPGGTVSEQLDALPQFFSTGTAQRGGPTLFGDGGGSYLDMRGLGRNRTLVLLDGSRVVPAEKRGTVNVDNIPTALVRSVDVITGGASAAYGADALGGVTNFVLDREFQGLKVSVSTGMNEFKGDGQNLNVEVAGGFDIGDRWNFIGSLQTRTIDEIYRNPEDLDSDWFQRWSYFTNNDPNGPARITLPWGAPTGSSPSGVISARGSALNGLQFTDDGTGVRPFILGDFTSTGRGAATSGGPEAKRYSDATSSPITGNGVENRTGFAALQYQATENVSIYGQAMIGRTESTNLAEHASFAMQTPWNHTIYRSNPYLPGYISDTESVPGTVAGIMDAEGRTSFSLNKVGSYQGQRAPSSQEYDRTVFTTESYTIGFNATLGNGWDLSGSYQTGESRKRGGQYPSSRVDREGLARDAVIDPATGAIVCNVQLFNPTEAELAASPAIQGKLSSRTGEQLKSPIGLDNTIRDCVPYNAMGTEGMSQAAWDYQHTAKIADSVVEMDFAELLLQGEAYEGWGYGPLSFATGVTWREQSFSDEFPNPGVDELGPPYNDPALGIRGIAGLYSAGSPNLHQFSTISFLSGKYDVTEVFGELNVPIWESDDGNSRLGGNLAFRRSDYSSSGAQDSWKAGLEWQIFEDLRFRATKSRDVREASFQERFDVVTGGTNIDDPFTGQMNVNVSFLRGGNPNLEPEEADTTVFGLVYEPSWLPGFRMSTDWWEVDISGAVDSVTEQQIVDQCFDSGGTASVCAFIKRDEFGVIGSVGAPFLNLSTSYAEGVDFESAYTLEPDFFGNEIESLSFRLLAGVLSERYDIPPGGVPIDQVGGSTRPEWTASFTARYSVGPWSFTWQQRATDEVLRNINWVEGVDIDDNTIPTYSFTNLNFRYDGGEVMGGGEWNVSLAVNNAFNKLPVIFPGTPGRVGTQIGSGNGNHDEFGRRYQLTLNVNF